MVNVRYRNLGFLGFPVHRVGTDGSLWSWKRDRKGNHRWKELHQGKDHGNGSRYRLVMLCHNRIRKQYSMASLVLIAFVGPRPKDKEACYNNGQSFDNSLNNLRWDTRENNQADRLKHGTSNRGIHINQGEKHGMSKLTWVKVQEIRDKYASGKYLQQQLADDFKISIGIINRIVNRKGWIT